MVTPRIKLEIPSARNSPTAMTFEADCCLPNSLLLISMGIWSTGRSRSSLYIYCVCRTG